jgi:hypothetical protein
LRQGKTPRLLVTIEGFLGWAGSQEWNDMAFLSWHGDEIAKIAAGRTR